MPMAGGVVKCGRRAAEPVAMTSSEHMTGACTDSMEMGPVLVSGLGDWGETGHHGHADADHGHGQTQTGSEDSHDSERRLSG
jgi:hypothetical protein